MPTTLDRSLADNLKRATHAPADHPYFFALVVKGGTDGQLIVSKGRVSEKQVAEAKKETGGSAVVKGVCFGEDGTLVFETPKLPAPAWTPLVKRLAKEGAGLALKAVFRQGRDPDRIPDESPDAPDAKDGAAAWQARVDAVTARVKAAATAKNPRARDMVLGISQAGAFFRGGKPADADAQLKEVEALLAAATPPAPPPPAAAARPATPPPASPSQVPPAPPPPAAAPASEWKAKLAAATPALKAALATKGPAAADVAKLFAQANALAKPGGDMAQALAKLGECHDLVRSATPPQAPTAAPKPAAGSEVTKRLSDLVGAIKAALKGPNAARVQALMVAVNGLIKNNDYAQAGKVLDELEPLLAGAVPPAAPPLADGLAAWKAARETVVKRLRRIADKINATGDADAPAVVIELLSIVKNLTSKPATPQQVAELDRYLRTDDVITDAEEVIPPDFYTPEIRKPLLAALEQIQF